MFRPTTNNAEIKTNIRIAGDLCAKEAAVWQRNNIPQRFEIENLGARRQLRSRNLFRDHDETKATARASLAEIAHGKFSFASAQTALCHQGHSHELCAWPSGRLRANHRPERRGHRTSRTGRP